MVTAVGGRVIAPQRIDDGRPRQPGARVQGEQTEHRPLRGRAERHRGAAAPGGQRAENADPQAAAASRRPRPGGGARVAAGAAPVSSPAQCRSSRSLAPIARRLFLQVCRPALFQVPHHADAHPGHVGELALGQPGFPAVAADQPSRASLAAQVHVRSPSPSAAGPVLDGIRVAIPS